MEDTTTKPLVATHESLDQHLGPLLAKFRRIKHGGKKDLFTSSDLQRIYKVRNRPEKVGLGAKLRLLSQLKELESCMEELSITNPQEDAEKD